jgi:hypothetical protein
MVKVTSECGTLMCHAGTAGITPRYELYENDMLHFLPEAYRKVLGPAILPVLASLWDGPHSREAPSQQSRM